MNLFWRIFKKSPHKNLIKQHLLSMTGPFSDKTSNVEFVK